MAVQLSRNKYRMAQINIVTKKEWRALCHYMICSETTATTFLPLRYNAVKAIANIMAALILFRTPPQLLLTKVFAQKPNRATYR